MTQTLRAGIIHLFLLSRDLVLSFDLELTLVDATSRYR